MLDIVILAAGQGSRMKSSLPKVLHPIAGKPLLGHVIDTARQISTNALHIIVGHGAEQVIDAIAADDIHAITQTQQLGTAHAVQQALPYLNDKSITLILYGDVPLIGLDTLQRLINSVDDNSLGLLTVSLEQPSGYGRIIRNEQQQVVAIVEQKDASQEQLAVTEVNTGVMAINSHHLQQWLPSLSNNNAQGEYYLTDVIAIAEQQGITINTQQPRHEWEVLGVNDRRQQAQLERIFQRNSADTLMQQGVTLSDPARFDCRGELSVGSDVFIDNNCLFEGKVILGNNVRIAPNCILKNAVIGDNTVINANSIIEDSHLESGCHIGPFARLRPGSQLAKGAKIGNFVETKKATIGEGSKVNHLSYVGDAVLGKNVNVGAGTITCNYDGVNKHQTTIGDNVFVGSNSALVAPITIDKGATVGAGSTINKSIDADTLALTRAPQRALKDWQRPEKKK